MFSMLLCLTSVIFHPVRLPSPTPLLIRLSDLFYMHVNASPCSWISAYGVFLCSLYCSCLFYACYFDSAYLLTHTPPPIKELSYVLFGVVHVLQKKELSSLFLPHVEGSTTTVTFIPLYLFSHSQYNRVSCFSGPSCSKQQRYTFLSLYSM